MAVEELGEDGAARKTREPSFGYAMLLPAFRGVPAVRGLEGLTNPRGYAWPSRRSAAPRPNQPDS